VSYDKEYYESHKEAHKLSMKKWYEANKDANKESKKEHDKEYYNNNKDDILVKKKKYRHDNAHKISQHDHARYTMSAETHRHAKMIRLYGITHDDYNALLKKQGGVCAICGNQETIAHNGKIVALSIDHDHPTNKVRGLLCGSCNRAIGLMKDDPERLMAAANYLLVKI